MRRRHYTSPENISKPSAAEGAFKLRSRLRELWARSYIPEHRGLREAPNFSAMRIAERVGTLPQPQN